MVRRRQSLVLQETSEKGEDAGERVLSRGGIGALDRDNAGGSPVLRKFADRRVGAVKPVICAEVDLHFDSGTARCRCVEQLLARRFRRAGADSFRTTVKLA